MSNATDKFGLSRGVVVQELGWDTDTDDELRAQIEDTIDGEMIDEAMEAVDVVLLWWRADDGDLTDGLVDSLTDLADDGVVWLLTPKVGRPGHVEEADIAEGALTAGLSATTTAQVSAEWAARKLVRPKSGRR